MAKRSRLREGTIPLVVEQSLLEELGNPAIQARQCVGTIKRWRITPQAVGDGALLQWRGELGAGTASSSDREAVADAA
jgi:hypothetical protein